MARITREGGDTYNEHELNDPDPPLAIRRFQLGDEYQFPGDNSAPSGLNESRSNAGETVETPSPAPMTGSPSGSPPTGETNSTAHSTAGDGRVTDPPSFVDDDVPPYDEWSNKDLKEECRVRGLTVSGNHDELVRRLMDNDAEADTDHLI